MSPTAIILASGFSERMGFDKALLRFNKKLTFIEKIVHEYKKFSCEKIIIVCGKWLKGNLKQLIEIDTRHTLGSKTQKIILRLNSFPEKGRMYSILSGLAKIEPTDYCFIQDCDNPLISGEVLWHLWKGRCSSGYSVPVFRKKRGHPVLLSPYVVCKLLLANNHTETLKEQLVPFKRKEVKVNDRGVLVNINTVADYRRYGI